MVYELDSDHGKVTEDIYNNFIFYKNSIATNSNLFSVHINKHSTETYIFNKDVPHQKDWGTRGLKTWRMLAMLNTDGILEEGDSRLYEFKCELQQGINPNYTVEIYTPLYGIIKTYLHHKKISSNFSKHTDSEIKVIEKFYFDITKLLLLYNANVHIHDLTSHQSVLQHIMKMGCPRMLDLVLYFARAIEIQIPANIEELNAPTLKVVDWHTRRMQYERIPKLTKDIIKVEIYLKQIRQSLVAVTKLFIEQETPYLKIHTKAFENLTVCEKRSLAPLLFYYAKEIANHDAMIKFLTNPSNIIEFFLRNGLFVDLVYDKTNNSLIGFDIFQVRENLVYLSIAYFMENYRGNNLMVLLGTRVGEAVQQIRQTVPAYVYSNLASPLSLALLDNVGCQLPDSRLHELRSPEVNVANFFPKYTSIDLNTVFLQQLIRLFDIDNRAASYPCDKSGREIFSLKQIEGSPPPEKCKYAALQAQYQFLCEQYGFFPNVYKVSDNRHYFFGKVKQNFPTLDLEGHAEVFSKLFKQTTSPAPDIHQWGEEFYLLANAKL